MHRTTADRTMFLTGLLLALLAAAALAASGANAGEDRSDGHDGGASGSGGGVEVVWASSTGRSASVDCPAGAVAVGGGIEGPTNNSTSPIIGSPNTYPGRTQTPWVASSVPTGPGIPAANEDFDFTTGAFATPSGLAAAPTGWYGQVSNNPAGGVRVYAICIAV